MGSKILIVEDNAQDRKIITKVLNKAGLRDLVYAQDGYQGTSLAHKEKPDLIILDINMPAGNGLSILQNLKMAAETENIPVIVHSGSKDEEHKKKVLRYGAEAFVEKSADPGRLLDAVQKVLNPPAEESAE
ncbi:MAG: response regulator [Candidatus Omnitrophota bacterium]